MIENIFMTEEKIRDLAQLRVLVIGDIARWSGAGRATMAFGDFAFCNLAGLRCDILRDFKPDIVF